MTLEVLGCDDLPRAKRSARSPSLEERDLGVLAQGSECRRIVDRPAIQNSLVNALREGRGIALVGGDDVGKTSPVLALARAGGFQYRSIDYGVSESRKILA